MRVVYFPLQRSNMVPVEVGNQGEIPFQANWLGVKIRLLSGENVFYWTYAWNMRDAMNLIGEKLHIINPEVNIHPFFCYPDEIHADVLTRKFGNARRAYRVWSFMPEKK